MAYAHHNFPQSHFFQDGFLPQHPFLMPASGVSSSISTSQQATTSLHHGNPTYSDHFMTPRHIAPHQSYILPSPGQEYRLEESYTTSSDSTSARGRSGSGVSTVSVDYNRSSTSTTPVSSYSLNGTGSQYSAMYDNQALHIDEASLDVPAQEQLARNRDEKEYTARHRAGSSSSSNKTITKDRVFCPHEDCLDENRRPRKFFSRKADVTRHHKSRHEITFIDCPKRNCDRKGRQGFTRRDHLTEHLRGFHMEKIAKRQAGSNKDKHDDSGEVNTFSVHTTHPDRPDDINRILSRESGMVQQGRQPDKQDLDAPLDDSSGDDDSADEDYRVNPAKASKMTMQTRKRRSKAVRYHPYQRRSSKPLPHHFPAKGKCLNLLDALTIAPGFAESQLMSPPPVYTASQAASAVYKAQCGTAPGYSTQRGSPPAYSPQQDSPPMYSTQQGIPLFFDGSSISPEYDDHQMQPTTQYPVRSLAELDYSSMRC